MNFLQLLFQLLISFAGIVFFALSALSQDFEKRDDFFSKDFANSGGLANDEREDKDGIYGKNQNQAPPQIVSDIQPDELAVQQPPINVPSAEPVTAVALSPQSIDRLILILSSEQPEDLEALFAQSPRIKQKLALAVFVGKPGNDKKMTEYLQKEGINVQRRYDIPLDLQYSPSWIIQTGNEAVILDGARDPFSKMGSGSPGEKESRNETFDVSGF